MSAHAGLFVVFEGGDGVGKSTQADLLCARLEAHGRPVVRTFEPGDTAVGQILRRIVLDPATGDLSPRAETLIYAADKAQHLYEVVLPALRRGAVVVCDRYVDSMLAYQGAGRAAAADEIEQIARWATGDLRPDLTVLLDTAPDEAVHTKADKDRLESAGEDFHDRVRLHFLDLAGRDPGRYVVLDARRTREELAELIAERVDAALAGPQPDTSSVVDGTLSS